MLINNYNNLYININIQLLKGGGENILKKKRLAPTIMLISLLILNIFFSGCIEEEEPEGEKLITPIIERDMPSILPSWQDGKYHDYYKTTDFLSDLQVKYPDLVSVFSIGESVLGREIWCIRVTNENSYEEKLSCLIDGCIHGCEWEASEACLYLSEYLLINFDKNETITQILNTTQVYIVPLYNPDGRQVDFRFNDNGVDLNRNFDVDFGRIRGSSMSLGRRLGKKYPYLMFERLHKWFPKFPLFLTNSGPDPFSEPETRAICDLMKELESKDLSFYLNCHTAVHNFAMPWGCAKPPFEMSEQQYNIMQAVVEWVAENTEYDNADMKFEGYSYKSSGTAMDWTFKEFKIPSFTFELLNPDFEPQAGGGIHQDLIHWMKTTLPVFMYLLVNIENLHNWEEPDIYPPLPKGIPPEPFEIKGTGDVFFG